MLVYQVQQSPYGHRMLQSSTRFRSTHNVLSTTRLLKYCLNHKGIRAVFLNLGGVRDSNPLHHPLSTTQSLLTHSDQRNRTVLKVGLTPKYAHIMWRPRYIITRSEFLYRNSCVAALLNCT